ncbi:MAG TPA: hypothetical protein VH253_10180 [Phycisphaerae bacterium]|nr:hypothetical protein [Phycisphaerae bacterium]
MNRLRVWMVLGAGGVVMAIVGIGTRARGNAPCDERARRVNP